MEGLFGQGKGQVFSGPASQTAYVVGRVDAIRPAVPALAAPVAEQVRARMAEQMGNAMVENALAAGALRSKAKSDTAFALQALGVDPATATTPSSAPTPTPAQ
jgi:peptidyl-prolyl cis-trans isomerase D